MHTPFAFWAHKRINLFWTSEILICNHNFLEWCRRRRRVQQPPHPPSLPSCIPPSSPGLPPSASRPPGLSPLPPRREDGTLHNLISLTFFIIIYSSFILSLAYMATILMQEYLSFKINDCWWNCLFFKTSTHLIWFDKKLCEMMKRVWGGEEEKNRVIRRGIAWRDMHASLL